MNAPLLDLRALRREYPSGEQSIIALRDVDLSIEAGEMVAIVGSSGSGKSTLMNILGCLDRPSAGTYRVAGHETNELDADSLAALRREHFGFVFQRYNLLPRLSACANVELPAIYAGMKRHARRERAVELLTRLGLGDRLDHRPSQLSGGQQQRVSIARALMNGGQVILADEPTGAVDRTTGEQILESLQTLHATGHTIILVTHDPKVAGHAQRIIELSDGRIIADRRRTLHVPVGTAAQPAAKETWLTRTDRVIEAFRIAFVSMKAHRLRTFLTMLGIVIGIASVVAVVALGEGSRQYILKQIAALGTKSIDINPGKDMGDVWANRVHTLTPTDSDSLAGESYVDSATPSVYTQTFLRYRNIEVQAQVAGVGEQFFRVHGRKIVAGTTFDRVAVHRLAQEVVIDLNTQKKLFPDQRNPIGEIILIGTLPCRIIGVVTQDPGMGYAAFLYVWAPYTTVMTRLTGQSHVQGLTIRFTDSAPMEASKNAIVNALTLRHGRKDFFIFDTDTLRKTIESTTLALKMLISLIAAISLVIGGIGIMNITLVSVTERTQEIGVRMAVGARRSDILNQFLVEATLVCLLGGIVGVLLAFGIGLAVGPFVPFTLVFSLGSIVVAFSCAALIGIVFGFVPARNAARLDPVDALARD
jgi:macrolide transport system ATP-binding/permease protein